MLDPHFAIVGAVLAFLGDATYARDTFLGKNRPNVVTWFLWALTPLITFGVEVTQKVGLPAVLPLAVGLGPVAVIAGAFVRRGTKWQLGFFDYACGILSVIALLLWFERQGDVAIFFSILADWFAGLPTIVKAFKHPESESWLAYALSSVAALITLLSVHVWTFASVAFPIFMMLSCLNFTLLIRLQWGLKFSRQS